jgi:GT2 family glycosyltransferase
MDVSVVVNTRNRPDRLRILLAAFAAQRGVPDGFEVIVVDDGSDQDLSPSLRGHGDLPIRLIRQDRKGYAGARNTGVRAAVADLVLCVDDDVTFDIGFVAEHVAAHREHGPGIVVGDRYNTFLADLTTPENRGILTDAAQGRWEPLRRRSRRDYFAAQTLALFERDRHALPVPWLCFVTRNVSFRRADAERAGHFDEGFRQWGLEDLELGLRLHRAGVPYHYAPAARVYHLETSLAPTKLDALHRSLRYFADKHPGVESATLRRFLFGECSLEEMAASVAAGREVDIDADQAVTYFFTRR